MSGIRLRNGLAIFGGVTPALFAMFSTTLCTVIWSSVPRTCMGGVDAQTYTYVRVGNIRPIRKSLYNAPCAAATSQERLHICS